ncbi:MAG TPA: acylphosphatase [Oligoflexus sp.]|uniref:acylphosphatase n=1 Tax=Oligoflexus sp. TaxID=1971216 RepID=UPI002D5BDD6D|nr:acylphosphatase [Oligoflexus sp.]HYX37132.1 acylphosphatase [Oligoflexus sp.]
MKTVAKRFFFKGRVQGVGFRFHTQSIAASFPVQGFVQNLPDGRVEMHAEGEGEVLAALLQAIQDRFTGYIQSYEVQDVTTLQLTGFEIRR